MKKRLFVTSLLATAISATSAFAAVEGGSSDTANVSTGSSTLFGSGDAGIKLAGSSAYIDLAGGPIAQSNSAISGGADGLGNYYLEGGDINFLAGLILGDTKIAQVWKDTDSSAGADFVVNSMRQMIVPPSAVSSFMPNFGGLVIGQVADASGDPLAVDSGVYFGEWSPKGSGYAAENSADLNMTSADRTVWYVGDDAVTSTPTLDGVQYGVVGISQTGTDSSGVTLDGGLPDSVNLYKGTLTANYCSGCSGNELTGSISRTVGATTQTIDFDTTTTTINNDGTFGNSAVTNTIEGRFYNDAEALAGMYTNGTYDDVAFGGSKISGTITP